MKVKIISSEDYQELEKKFNDFQKDKTVITVSHFECYDIPEDKGFVTYHVFYTEQLTEL